VTGSGEVGQGRTVSHRAGGRKTEVTVDLGSRTAGKIRVRFIEHIEVAGHNETVTFTRIYRRC
jgi:hypothetical protein